MKNGSSKHADQRSAVVETAPSVATVSDPSPLVGTGLIICSNAKARQCTQRVLQYLESLKNAETKLKGNLLFFTALGCLVLLLTSSFLFLQP
jgi:hypothetical protein